MKRRRFIGVIAGGPLTTPLTAEAQPKRKGPTIGLLFANTPLADMLGPQPTSPHVRAFLDALREFGWVGGTPAQPLTSTGPFPTHLVGAKSKDAVENRLHKEVCDGKLTLREAQYIIATDWFKYYREKILK